MKIVPVLFLLHFSMGLSSGTTIPSTVANYTSWKIADITAWHTFYPMRYLRQEEITNELAAEAKISISDGLSISLASIVVFQKKELATAQALMEGTNAAGCISGIADYMTSAISDEISTFEDCSADAQSKFIRLNRTLGQVNSKYQVAYQRALTGITTCALSYPNKNSIDRLKSCVETMNTAYFTAAAKVKASLWPSPTMKYFTDVVLGCATDAATNVASKGTEFLQMLVECAVLSNGAVDPTTYKDELSEWEGYTDTLADQVANIQYKSQKIVSDVEAQVEYYYNLQKEALETYVIQSRGFSHYYNLIYSYLADYYNTMTNTLLDNQGSNCVDGRNDLDNAVTQGAFESLVCDELLVLNTTKLILDVNSHFLMLNNILPDVGNNAILSCILNGYIFAPKTISDCAALTQISFEIEYLEHNRTISSDLDTLISFDSYFYSYDFLPCGRDSLRRVLLAADKALYKTQRCLYTSYGTNYAVTTPLPIA